MGGKITLKVLLPLKKVNKQNNKEVTIKIQIILRILLCFISCCLKLFFQNDCLIRSSESGSVASPSNGNAKETMLSRAAKW